MSLTPEAQKIIGEAVVELLRRKRPAAPGLGDIGIPVKIGSAADVQALALLAAKLARLEPYGDLLLQGRIRFDVSFAGQAGRPAPGQGAARPCASASDKRVLSEPVLTEAMLRRQPGQFKEVEIPPRGLVTPSARDYANSRGIRIVRSAS